MGARLGAVAGQGTMVARRAGCGGDGDGGGGAAAAGPRGRGGGGGRELVQAGKPGRPRGRAPARGPGTRNDELGLNPTPGTLQFARGATSWTVQRQWRPFEGSPR